MAIQFQTDPLVAPRAARISALRAAAERATEIANQAELTTASLEGGAIADMRADQAARGAVQGWLGGAPATETVPLGSQGRTLAETPRGPPRPLEVPQEPVPQPGAAAGTNLPGPPAAAPPLAANAPAPADAPVMAPTAPQPAQQPPSALRGPGPAPPPAQSLTPAAPAPAQGGSSPPQAGLPAPAPPAGSPASAGAGNPIVQRQSSLMRDLVQRYAAIPGGGTAALRMANQEASRQLAVLATVLQVAGTNPQQALALMREHGLEVTPETQAMILDGALRQRTLQALRGANARYGTAPRSAGLRTSYLEGALGGGGQPVPGEPQQPGGPPIADALDRSGGLTAPAPGGGFTRDPFNGGRMVIPEIAGQEDTGGGAPEFVPPSEAPFREDFRARFDDYSVPAAPGAPPAATGRPAAAPRTSVSAGPTDERVRQDGMAWVGRLRVSLPGVANPAPLTSPEAQAYALDAFIAQRNGDREGFIQNMERARRVQMGQPADQEPITPGADEVVPHGTGLGQGGVRDFIRSLMQRVTGEGRAPPQPGAGFVPPGTETPAFPNVGGTLGRQGASNRFGQRGGSFYGGGPQTPIEGIDPEQPSMQYDETPPTIFENGTMYEFTGRHTSGGRPIYRDSATGDLAAPE